MMAGATRLSSPKLTQGSTMTWVDRRRWELKSFSKQTSLWFTPFWSTNPTGRAQMVGSILTAYLLGSSSSQGGKADWGEAAHSALERCSTDGIITIVGRKSTLTIANAMAWTSMAWCKM